MFYIVSILKYMYVLFKLHRLQEQSQWEAANRAGTDDIFFEYSFNSIYDDQ